MAQIALFPKKVVAKIHQDEKPQHYSCGLRKGQSAGILRIGQHVLSDYDVNDDGDHEKAPENNRRSALIHEQFSELGSDHVFTSELFTTFLKPVSCLLPVQLLDTAGCSPLIADDIRA